MQKINVSRIDSLYLYFTQTLEMKFKAKCMRYCTKFYKNALQMNFYLILRFNVHLSSQKEEERGGGGLNAVDNSSIVKFSSSLLKTGKIS